MAENTKKKQDRIRLGTHGEDYGSWMSTPVFIMLGALLVLALLLTVLSFTVFHITVLGIIFTATAVLLLLMLFWIAWVRRQYAFHGGRLMEKVHKALLAELDFDGTGTLLEVGCGSAALAIRAALMWPEARIIGLDYWAAVYNYSQALCEKNAESEGVAARCTFRHGDARKLDFPDESVDAVISNYVYHNITGSDKQALLLESLRVLKKGGVFALNDAMRPKLYGNMDAFVEKLKDMGYTQVRLVDSATEIFGSEKKASLLFLGGSKMLVGRK